MDKEYPRAQEHTAMGLSRNVLIQAATTLYEGSLMRAAKTCGMQRKKAVAQAARDWTANVGSSVSAADLVFPAIYAISK